MRRRQEEHEQKSAADARQLGHAYLLAWALWNKMDPDQPRMKKPSWTREYKSGFPDPPRNPLDEDMCEAIGNIVLTLPEDEQEVVHALYRRKRRRRASGAEWWESVRFWRAEDCARAIQIPYRTFYRRLASARERVENKAQEAGLPLPM